MKIFEVISEADESSLWQNTKDFVKSIPDRAASGAQTADDWARGTANYVTGGRADQATAEISSRLPGGGSYDQELAKEKSKSQEAEKRSPNAYTAIKRTAKEPFQTADDAMRAAGNELTFGMADQWAANAAANPNATDKEFEFQKQLDKQQELSKAAKERSPAASATGQVGSYAIAPVFGAGMKVAAKGGGFVAQKVLPKITKALTTPGKNIATNIGKKVVTVPAKIGTEIAGGMSADELAKTGIKQYDPYNASEYNDYLKEETLRLKQLINYRNT